MNRDGNLGESPPETRRDSGYNVRFFRVTELVTMLIEAKGQRVLARLKTQLSKLDLLVLDLCRLGNYADPLSRLAEVAG